MLTSEQESETQIPRPYDPHSDIVVLNQQAKHQAVLEEEVVTLREALGASLVWILQHPCDNTGEHIDIIRRIEKLLHP